MSDAADIPTAQHVSDADDRDKRISVEPTGDGRFELRVEIRAGGLGWMTVQRVRLSRSAALQMRAALRSTPRDERASGEVVSIDAYRWKRAS